MIHNELSSTVSSNNTKPEIADQVALGYFNNFKNNTYEFSAEVYYKLMQNQICFLLSYLKYGDNDAFLDCFSLEEGYQSFFAKGIYSAKNKKKPYLLPLNLLNISVVKKGINKGIPLVSKIELASEFHDFNEVKTTSILFFVAEFLNQILREEGASEATFGIIHNFRENLKDHNYNAHLILLFQFLSVCGITPHSNENKYLNPESGIFEDEVAHPIFTEEISLFWKICSITLST